MTERERAIGLMAKAMSDHALQQRPWRQIAAVGFDVIAKLYRMEWEPDSEDEVKR